MFWLEADCFPDPEPGAENLKHVSTQWPNFRDWIITRSGYQWSSKQILGRAEGEGINVEALTSTPTGNLLIGFRGPLTDDGRTFVFEIKLPASGENEPAISRVHKLPQIDPSQFAHDTVKTIRALTRVPGELGQYYVFLGPKGYEKESVVLARWNSNTEELVNLTQLPKNFVGEAVTSVPGTVILVVDDLQGMVLFSKRGVTLKGLSAVCGHFVLLIQQMKVNNSSLDDQLEMLSNIKPVDNCLTWREGYKGHLHEDVTW